MGIKPSGDHPVIVPPDNIQSRWDAWEADLDSTGQVAGEVFAETHAIAESANQWISANGLKLQGLVEDSAGIGDESKTIQQQMRELIDPENPDSELWLINAELHRLSSERDDIQDEALDLLGQVQELQGQALVRMLPVLGGSSGAEDSYVSIYPDPTDPGYWRVQQKGNWNGIGTFHGSLRLSDPQRFNNEPFVLDFSLYASGTTDGSVNRDGVFYYVVRPGIPMWAGHDISPGSLPQSGAWFDEWSFETPAGATREYKVSFRVIWSSADRGSTYRMRIFDATTGTQVWINSVSGIGPVTPFGDGERTRSFTLDMSIPPGRQLVFQLSATGGSSQRHVGGGFVDIRWVQEPGS